MGEVDLGGGCWVVGMGIWGWCCCDGSSEKKKKQEEMVFNVYLSHRKYLRPSSRVQNDDQAHRLALLQTG